MKNIILCLCSFLLFSCFTGNPTSLVIHNSQTPFKEAFAIEQGLIKEIGPEHQIRNKYNGKKTLDVKKQILLPLANIMSPMSIEDIQQINLPDFENTQLKQGVGSVYITINTLEDLDKLSFKYLTPYIIITLSQPEQIQQLLDRKCSFPCIVKLTASLLKQDHIQPLINALIESSIQLQLSDTLFTQSLMPNQILNLLLKHPNHKTLLTITDIHQTKHLNDFIKAYTLIPLIPLLPKEIDNKHIQESIKHLYIINKSIALYWKRSISQEWTTLFSKLKVEPNSDYLVEPLFWSKSFFWNLFTHHQPLYLKQKLPSINVGEKASFFTAPFSPIYITKNNLDAFKIHTICVNGTIL